MTRHCRFAEVRRPCAAEALPEAQLAMVRDGKAPLYWAPFILIGECPHSLRCSRGSRQPDIEHWRTIAASAGRSIALAGCTTALLRRSP